jgi:hypothetical protein
MAFDRSKLGNLAAEQMQALEEKYGDDEENIEIGAVLTIVQVLKRERDNEFSSVVRVRHNVPDPYAVIGLLRAAELTVTQQIVGGD